MIIPSTACTLRQQSHRTRDGELSQGRSSVFDRESASDAPWPLRGRLRTIAENPTSSASALTVSIGCLYERRGIEHEDEAEEVRMLLAAGHEADYLVVRVTLDHLDQRFPDRL